MPNPGDIDPARAIQGVRQQRAAEEARKEAAEQRAQEQRDQHRANVLNLLRYADEQLEEILNPVVSEFVVTERWYTPTSKTVLDASGLRPNEVVRGGKESVWVWSFFRRRLRYRYRVATIHERQTRYYGSWLSLETYYGRETNDWGQLESLTQQKRGLVKLRQPHSGYARVDIENDCDPRKVGEIIIEHTDRLGRKEYGFRRGNLRTYASLEKAATGGGVKYQNTSVEELTKAVARALDFVATG